jgi:haloalkane dehalogenase
MSKTNLVVGTRTWSFIDQGQAASTLLLLHGNPTSKEQWRHFVGPLSAHHRVLAPDLFDPSHPSDLVDTARQLGDWLDVLEVAQVTVVAHDWGVAIAAELLRQRPSLVVGMVFFEGLLFPLSLRHNHWVPWLLCHFFGWPWIGELLLVRLNLFVRVLAPLGHRFVMEEKLQNHYRRTYSSLAMRQTALHWLRQVPTSPRHPNFQRVEDNRQRLCAAPIPKLFFFAQPGFATNRRACDELQNASMALTTVDLGDGIHFLDDDHREAMLLHLQRWLGDRRA